ncbi:unnamed protein product [Meloidogyne enterolobii]|uniref:Uncharacterized protein n=1 Tax=Meloidogyne enterolobii TaxID=390850 RepID=A0ACB1ACU5_MELEN
MISRIGGPIRPGSKDRVGHRILARKRLGRPDPKKMSPEKNNSNVGPTRKPQP